jgi:hypothetical protein
MRSIILAGTTYYVEKEDGSGLEVGETLVLDTDVQTLYFQPEETRKAGYYNIYELNKYMIFIKCEEDV